MTNRISKEIDENASIAQGLMEQLSPEAMSELSSTYNGYNALSVPQTVAGKEGVAISMSVGIRAQDKIGLSQLPLSIGIITKNAVDLAVFHYNQIPEFKDIKFNKNEIIDTIVEKGIQDHVEIITNLNAGQFYIVFFLFEMNFDGFQEVKFAITEEGYAEDGSLTLGKYSILALFSSSSS